MLKQNRKLAVRLRLKSKNPNVLGCSNQADNNAETTASQFLQQQNKALCANIDELSKINLQHNQIKDLKSQLELVYNKRQSQLQAAFESKLLCETLRKVRVILISLMKQSSFMLELWKHEQNQKQGKEGEMYGSENNNKNTEICQTNNNIDNNENLQQELAQSNHELKRELSEMEHYIITLKQLLNEQEKKTQSLLQQNLYKQLELNTTMETLRKKQSECKILQQEIAGYEQKIEQLQNEQISDIKQLKNINQLTNTNQQLNSNEELNNVSFETSLELNNINHENEQVELKNNSKGNSKEIDMQKLEVIYQKTEKLLKKCQHLQQTKNSKEVECSTLKKIIQSVMHAVGIQHITTNINEQTGIRIIDKIETLKSKYLKIQSEKQKAMDNLQKNVEQLESLLKQSNQWLANQNNDFYDFMNHAYSDEGIDVFKVNEYLDELQKTIKSIYKLKYGDLQTNYMKKIQQQQNYLNVVLQNFDSFTKDTQKFVFNVLKSAQGNVQNLQSQVKKLADHIKQLKQYINTVKNQRSEIQKKSNEIINEEVSKMMKKYYPQSLDFVEDLITKIMHLRFTQKEQQVSLILDSIFESIKVKDQQIKNQMGRKKQVVKLRSAAIAQICKKGMKDSFSIQK